MKKVFMIHGFEGSPNGGWRPWLMSELQKLDVYACSLSMPNPGSPIPSEWVEEIARHIETSGGVATGASKGKGSGNPKDHIYLVGHSLGVPAILRFIEQTNAKNIKGIVLVSGPIFKTTKKKVVDFLKKPFDFAKIKSKAKKIAVIHGDDDRSVSIEQGEFAAQKFGTKLIVIKNGGHLNGSSGHRTLPECLEALKRMMK